MAASGGIVVFAKVVSSSPPPPPPPRTPTPRPSHDNLSTRLYTSPINTRIRRRLSDSKLFHYHHHNHRHSINYNPTTTTLCQAVGDGSATSSTVYQGIYGPWTVDSDDVREVILYRSGLVTAATSFVAAASAAFLPDNIRGLLEQNLDLFYLLGGVGLGLSLVLIHIYVTQIKRMLQVLWLLGVVGSTVTYTSLAAPAGQGLIQYVVDNPTAIWFVGPLFAALTGLVFKEGLCYGKLEAGLLTFIIPAVLLGHLTGWMDDGIKLALLGSWMALFVIFAGRKFSQPIKDDIGDKSVFMFNSLPEDEKKALIEKLEQQKLGQNRD